MFIGAVRGNAALFALTQSSAAFESCVLSLAASDYGATVTGSDSIVYARESTIIVAAQTAVGFSLGNSVFTLLDSSFSAAGQLARAAELVRSTFRITGNKFTLRTNTPVWFDRESVADALADNTHEAVVP
jgi:hypothetical protein